MRVVKVGLLVCFFLFVGFGYSTSGVLYKWVDKQGQIHITDYPPPEEELQAEPAKIETKEKKAITESPAKTQQPEILLDFEPPPEPPEPEVIKQPPIKEERAPSEKTPPIVFKPQKGAQKKFKLPTGNYLGLFMFGGMTVIVFIIAFTLLLYFFYSLCLYLISKKLEVSYAWLSWVPLLQIFPFIEAARKPLWWVVFFLIPGVLGFFSSSFLFWILSIIASIVAFIVGVILWMSITENLGLNKWLGLLAFVPLVQLFYMGYIAFKSEPEREVSIKRPLLISLGVYLLLVIIIAAVFNYIVMPALTKAIKTGLESTIKEESKQLEETINMLKDTSRVSSVKGLKEKTVKRTKVVALSERDYERVLSSKRVDFKGGPKASLGPVALKLDHFWESPESPHLWLKVRTVSIPNLLIGSPAVVEIDRILSRDGRDLYNRESNFETTFFQKIRLRKTSSGDYFEAIRDVYLRPGTKEEMIKTVEGKLKLVLPVGVKEIVLDKLEKGITTSADGVTITVEDVGESEIVIRYQGKKDLLLDILGFNNKGEQLQSGGSSTLQRPDGLLIKSLYKGKIDKVHIIVASGFFEKEFPFKISR
jgi:hypothetical protein